MYNPNDNQQVKYMGADSLDSKPESPPETSCSPKGKRKGVKLSPGVKIALRIALTILFLWGYYTTAGAVAMFRIGFMGKMAEEIKSAVAVGKILKDNPSVFFTGEADVAWACGLTPEMRRWNGWYYALRFFTFTLGKDTKEWNIYLFTEKEEDAENIKRNLASMLSELDEKDKKVLHVRKYHVYFYHAYPAPSPWDPEEFAKMPSYADYRLDLDHL